MSPRLRTALRAIVIAAGAAVTLLAASEVRAADWPIYATYVAVATVLYLFYVEVLPNMPLPIPGLAATIGFLYVGGLPIVLFQIVASVLSYFLYQALPERWQRWAHPGVTTAQPVARRGTGEFVFGPDWGAFLIGLAARAWIAGAIAPGERPTAHPGVMAIAELGSYVVWASVSALPIYAFRSPIWAMAERGFQPLLQDMFVIFVLGLTPFVFMIAYGYQAHGLPGAALWALSTIGLHALLKSLHERRVGMEALNRELEHRERLSAIGRMSSVVSHQILQQLGIIRLYTDLIRNGDATGDPAAAVGRAKANAGRVEDALDGVNRVMTDLLVFSRDLRLNLYEHALGDLLAECVAECEPQATERGVALRLECEPDLRVTIDKLKVKQAVANVIRNAVEVSPAGTAVLVQGARRDEAIEVTVIDRGPGIPEPERAAIFMPFFTTKETGTGLGLAIAREFVVAHGGEIRVDGRAGDGACFVVRLPLRPGA
ncbi:MAG TPA: HAMP domain-containing sensor histidine kinase [Candidatus Eisenbacteria bacterium]|nr:HAMP domain-containing sensor histidine kinase [Candidatus Eisenbacteria bacterium]